MSMMTGWQMLLGIILALLVIGYGEYRLWTGTKSPTARGLSVLFAVTIAWRIIHRVFL